MYHFVPFNAAADSIQLPYLYTYYTDYDYSRTEIAFLLAVYYFSASMASISLGVAADRWYGILHTSLLQALSQDRHTFLPTCIPKLFLLPDASFLHTCIRSQTVDSILIPTLLCCQGPAKNLQPVLAGRSHGLSLCSL